MFVKFSNIRTEGYYSAYRFSEIIIILTIEKVASDSE